MFNRFLTSCAEACQLKNLTDQGQGVCALSIDEIPCLFELDETVVQDHVILSTQVASFPVDQQRFVMETCLKLNAHAPATLSIKPHEPRVMMHQRIPCDIDPQELRSIITDFVTRVERAQQSLIPPVDSEGSIGIFPNKV